MLPWTVVFSLIGFEVLLVALCTIYLKNDEACLHDSDSVRFDPVYSGLQTGRCYTTWWLVEVPYWWNRGCFMTFLGIFPREVKDIIFAYARWDLCEVRLKWTLENSELRKSQISFLGRGDLWWVGWGMWDTVGHLKMVAITRNHKSSFYKA